MFAITLILSAAAQVRELKSWEGIAATSLDLVGSSSTIMTYADYRSYNLVQESEVYLGFIADNLRILSESFVQRGMADPGIYFLDMKNGAGVCSRGSIVVPLGKQERETVFLQLASLGETGISRPSLFGSEAYRFSKRIAQGSQEFYLLMELPNPFKGIQLALLASIFLVPLVFALFIVLIARAVNKATRRISAPIEHLTELASAAKYGNLSARAVCETDDEIGDLADAFNSMLSQLSSLLHEKTAILESITDGFIAIDSDWNLTYVNAEAERILALDRKDIVGRKNWDVFPFTKGTEIEAFYRKVMETREPSELEYYNPFKDQWSNRWIAVKANPVEGGGISVYIKDITERKIAEKTLMRSLYQKEMLLHEVHHRVKNNLQIVASLVDLQAMLASAGDGAKHDVLLGDSFKNRLRIMSEIYENLAESSDFSSIDFTEYTRSLVSYLYMFFRHSFGAVSYEVKGDSVRLDLNHAFPCGLILNEVLSNAFRFAFPPERKSEGMVRITILESGQSHLELLVEDDGIGLPPGVGLASAEGIGFPLISLLSRQLEGKIELSSNGGTRYRFMFEKNSGVHLSDEFSLLADAISGSN